MSKIRALLVAAAVAAFLLFGAASPAQAVCGDGGLGEACYCPPIPYMNC